MNKFLLGICFFFYPLLVLADSSTLSFTPPATDFSVGFLSNIFGLVDGVLHGTGSQMMGSIFTVFNAAVLALGGIIIMYTLIVGTLNTAHEGKMLGQKWSSIWIPVRSTTGLALLIPKASGYCLMQIFVMWTVVQGVGAADKVWNAALAYLNRGGVIIQASMSPETANNTDNQSVVAGARAILSGQVCMLGVQKLLEAQRKMYLQQKSSKTGPCYVASGKLPQPLDTFCTTSVPDFLATIDASTYQSTIDSFGTKKTAFSLPMPYFSDNDYNSVYASLNGICGYIQWNPIAQAIVERKKVSYTTTTERCHAGGCVTYKHKHSRPVTTTDLQIEASALKADDMETIRLSRATAIQQMYLDYMPVATSIVNNDPAFATSTTNTDTPDFKQAIVAFGVPYNTSGVACSTSDTSCSLWRSELGNALFTGTEFQYGILDYAAIMMPTVSLISQARGSKNLNNTRNFIDNAQADGWMNAGSYFFSLVALNMPVQSYNYSSGGYNYGNNNTNATDQDTGLEQSISKASSFLTAPSCPSNDANFKFLCRFFNNPAKLPITAIGELEGTAPSASAPLTPVPEISTEKSPSLVDPASTVQGFMANSMVIQIPGTQPPYKVINFKMPLNLTMQPGLTNLPEHNFPCGKVGLKYVGSVCLGKILGEVFYNNFLRWILNIIASYAAELENNMLLVALYTPLSMIKVIFTNGVNMIQSREVNPIIALAQMGIAYINESITMWFSIINVILASFIVFFPLGFLAVIVVILISPLLISWMGVMVAIGFTTAFYLPFLPYLIFTFGTIAWLMAVIEAMVAAPIVALGVTHPEGEGILGKGEAAIMLLMNVFLRPSMMIIGYIAGIMLCYVSVWIINAGFSNVLSFLQTDAYTSWAGIYSFFFGIVVYTTAYLAVAEKSFTLIHILPDQVLRWIGGHAEQYGEKAAGWTDQVKQKSDEASKSTLDAQAQTGKKITGVAVQTAGAAADMAAPGSGKVVKGIGGAAVS